MKYALVFLLLGQAVGLKFTYIKALEETKRAHKEGTTLLISVNQGDVDQIPLRLPKIVKAQNHKFLGGKWLVYDNAGVKPSQQMRQVMEKAKEDQLVDGWMEVDYSPEGLTNLYQKVGMQFAPNWLAPEGNHARFWMMEQCKTEYCAHYDLNTVSFALDGYSWIDRGINVINNNEDILQVVASTPAFKYRNEISFLSDTAPNKQSFESSLLESQVSVFSKACQGVMSEARENQGVRFISGRMFLMHKARYEKMFPISGKGCKSSDLRWEEVMSCQTCSNNMKRATLNEGFAGWHLEFPAPAGPELEKALDLVEQGVPVKSKLIPYRPA